MTHEYTVEHHRDGSFSVALPEGEELRVFPPQHREIGLTIEDEYVRTYLWERGLIAVDEDPVLRERKEWVGLDDDEEQYFKIAQVPREQLLKWVNQRLKEKNK